jgi:hypothetical protein
MDDSTGVRDGKRVSHRDPNPQHLAHAQASTWNPPIETAALYALHDDEVHASGSFNLVNNDDVRVIESQYCASLLHKAAPTILVTDAIWRQHLNRDNRFKRGSRARYASPIPPAR